MPTNLLNRRCSGTLNQLVCVSHPAIMSALYRFLLASRALTTARFLLSVRMERELKFSHNTRKVPSSFFKMKCPWPPQDQSLISSSTCFSSCCVSFTYSLAEVLILCFLESLLSFDQSLETCAWSSAVGGASFFIYFCIPAGDSGSEGVFRDLHEGGQTDFLNC